MNTFFPFDRFTRLDCNQGFANFLWVRHPNSLSARSDGNMITHVILKPAAVYPMSFSKQSDGNLRRCRREETVPFYKEMT
jgi:hypothetical protein